MVESAREVCGSVRVGGRNPKILWWNNQVKALVKRKEGAWKEVLSARDEIQRKCVWKSTIKKREMLKRVYIKARRR